ncbi:MAG: 4,5-DOPA dioxygenase extradiol [Leptospiraceae bacterium]|nr:4,5-DOPA dioxygenase extradiol [Leptospiraceae bacterium]
MKTIRFPAAFLGHGSPMNAIEENSFSNSWKELGKKLPTPTAILSISAHWMTRGTFLTSNEFPKTIHDFGGFPAELFAINYPAKGSDLLVQRVKELVPDVSTSLNWGLDHGTWSVLLRIFPEANIPVVQLSLDANKSLEEHLTLAKKLSKLREENIFILGSGNIVHNLARMDLSNRVDPRSVQFDEAIRSFIMNRDIESVLNFSKLGDSARFSVPTIEHFLPLIYILGVCHEDDSIKFFNTEYSLGSISMTSLLL